jgi:hypothetical protein
MAKEQLGELPFQAPRGFFRSGGLGREEADAHKDDDPHPLDETGAIADSQGADSWHRRLASACSLGGHNER